MAYNSSLVLIDLNEHFEEENYTEEEVDEEKEEDKEAENNMPMMTNNCFIHHVSWRLF